MSEHGAAVEYIRALLAGRPPNGTPPEAFGAYRDLIEVLLQAYEAGGTRKVKEALNDAVRRHPEWAELISGDHAAPESWHVYTLADAYQPRSPVLYVVEGIVPMPSLSMVYGAPGTLKSLLLADLAICVAAELPWLPALPHTSVAPKRTRHVPVLWCDFDTGTHLTHERIAALASARALPETIPFQYVSMPSPWLDASSAHGLQPLAECIHAQQAKLVIVDNLLTVKGKADENSAEMGNVMANFRRLVEETDAAAILIHHQRKDAGTTTRAGDRLRGHSSIEAAIDLALLMEREPHAASLTLSSTKVRGVDVPPFGAHFTYTHKPGTTEFATARFFGMAVKDQVTDRAVEETILKTVRATPQLNKTELLTTVKAVFSEIGVHRIGGIIDRLEAQNTLKTTPGERGAKRYEGV